MPEPDQQLTRARQLLAGSFDAVLSTLSTAHPGFPFGSVAPYILDHEGLPLFLLSHLSQHTKNIDADERTGLMLLERGARDVQQRGRLSGIGHMQHLDTGADAERFFDYYPQMRDYHEQLGFRFYRYQPVRFHWNGGFATARWFAANRVVRANPLHRDAAREIIGHMNDDHRDALRHYLRDQADIGPSTEVTMVGIDGSGIDLRAADRLYRVALPGKITSRTQAREALVSMARA